LCKVKMSPLKGHNMDQLLKMSNRENQTGKPAAAKLPDIQWKDQPYLFFKNFGQM